VESDVPGIQINYINVHFFKGMNIGTLLLWYGMLSMYQKFPTSEIFALDDDSNRSVAMKNNIYDKFKFTFLDHIEIVDSKIKISSPYKILTVKDFFDNFIQNIPPPLIKFEELKDLNLEFGRTWHFIINKYRKSKGYKTKRLIKKRKTLKYRNII
jgi:hypothetical protein